MFQDPRVRCPVHGRFKIVPILALLWVECAGWWAVSDFEVGRVARDEAVCATLWLAGLDERGRREVGVGGKGRM